MAAIGWMSLRHFREPDWWVWDVAKLQVMPMNDEGEEEEEDIDATFGLAESD